MFICHEFQVIGHKVQNDKSDDEDGESESGSESGSDDGKRKYIPCPDDVDIREFRPVAVDCNEQYTRCVTDIQKFREECEFHPYSKLVY